MVEAELGLAVSDHLLEIKGERPMRSEGADCEDRDFVIEAFPDVVGGEGACATLVIDVNRSICSTERKSRNIKVCSGKGCANNRGGRSGVCDSFASAGDHALFT